MWLVGIETGLRISDLLSITAGVFLPDGSFELTEKKTKKVKKCHLSPELWSKVQEFRQHFRIAPDDYLFYRSAMDKKKPITRQWATRMIREEASKRGLRCIGSHSMRKVYACKLYLSYGEIKTVQAALNHKYPSTTLHYLADLLPGVGQGSELIKPFRPYSASNLPRPNDLPSHFEKMRLRPAVLRSFLRFLEWLRSVRARCG
jgi:integrase